MDQSNQEGLAVHELRLTLGTHAAKLGTQVEVEKGERDGVKFTRFDVIGFRSGDTWFCFALVLVHEDNSVGVWTREDLSQNVHPLDVPQDYQFQTDTVERWLEAWFDDKVLDELTRPL